MPSTSAPVTALSSSSMVFRNHVSSVDGASDSILFAGKNYSVCLITNNGVRQRQETYPLTHLGLPATLEKLDAAFNWGHNGKTYLFSGNSYWRIDTDTGKIELDYPRDMSMWGGVGYHIDAAFKWTDGWFWFLFVFPELDFNL